MALKHTFSKEEISEIENARKINKNKRVEVRLKALELRAKGVADAEIAKQTNFYPSTISRLVTKYKKNGIEAITGNHYHGNRRNMSIEEEAAILAPFREKAESGQIVEINEIKAAYQAKVDHPISDSQIYFVLHRHGWRKVMPRSKHPQKADDETIEASKKLKLEQKN